MKGIFPRAPEEVYRKRSSKESNFITGQKEETGEGESREKREGEGRGFAAALGTESLCSNYRGFSLTNRACPPTRFDLFRFRLTARQRRSFFPRVTRFSLVRRCSNFSHVAIHLTNVYVPSPRDLTATAALLATEIRFAGDHRRLERCSKGVKMRENGITKRERICGFVAGKVIHFKLIDRLIDYLKVMGSCSNMV